MMYDDVCIPRIIGHIPIFPPAMDVDLAERVSGSQECLIHMETMCKI